MWFGFSGFRTNSRTNLDVECTNDADCRDGTKCAAYSEDPKKPNKSYCFHKNPVPANGNYKLETD